MSEMIKRDKNNAVQRNGYGRITESDKWLPHGIMTASGTVVGVFAALIAGIFSAGLASVIAVLSGILFLATIVFGAQGAHKLLVQKSRD